MLYNFKTTDDGQQWAIDTEALTWAKASSILATPSVKAAESNIARFVAQEEGKLIPMGGGRYALQGRKPFDKDRKPQLSIFILLSILSGEDGGTAVTFMQANVDIKDLQHQEIKKFKCEVLPAIPAPNRPPQVQMPPITAEEKKAQEPPQVVDVEGTVEVSGTANPEMNGKFEIKQ
jgi:hypothetical protein